MKFDIETRLEHMESDKHYKENFEALDTAEMEIKTEQAAAPKDGEEPGTEE